MEDANEGLTIPEAMKALSVSHTTVQRMIDDGRLRVVEERWRGEQRRVWVSAADVAALKAKQKDASA